MFSSDHPELAVSLMYPLSLFACIRMIHLHGLEALKDGPCLVYLYPQPLQTPLIALYIEGAQCTFDQYILTKRFALL